MHYFIQISIPLYLQKNFLWAYTLFDTFLKLIFTED